MSESLPPDPTDGDSPIVRYRVGPPLHSSAGDTHADLAAELLGEPVDAPGDFPTALLGTDPPAWLRIRRFRVFRPDDPAPAIQRAFAHVRHPGGRPALPRQVKAQRLAVLQRIDAWKFEEPDTPTDQACLDALYPDSGITVERVRAWRKRYRKDGSYTGPTAPE